MPPRPEPTFEALAALAAQHHQARRFREAAAVYRKIGKLVPGAPEPIYNEATALWAVGEIDAAVGLLKRVAMTPLRLRPWFESRG
jgi:Flp pilus assembly protein TadD